MRLRPAAELGHAGHAVSPARELVLTDDTGPVGVDGGKERDGPGVQLLARDSGVAVTVQRAGEGGDLGAGRVDASYRKAGVR